MELTEKGVDTQELIGLLERCAKVGVWEMEEAGLSHPQYILKQGFEHVAYISKKDGIDENDVWKVIGLLQEYAESKGYVREVHWSIFVGLPNSVCYVRFRDDEHVLSVAKKTELEATLLAFLQAFGEGK